MLMHSNLSLILDITTGPISAKRQIAHKLIERAQFQGNFGLGKDVY